MVWATSFHKSTIGKKVIMAVTGVIMLGFLIGHMAGNLQLFLGEEKFDAYAAFLKATPALLWGTRAVLLVSIVLHVWAAVSLTGRNRSARPVGYTRYTPLVSAPPSRTMLITGAILLAFIVYHLMHFTFGMIHPNFEHIRAFRNVVIAFRSPIVAIVYLASMFLLAWHLYHGIWSTFQTIGLNHPKYNRFRRVLAILLTLLICGGFAILPLAVFAGFVTSPAP